MKTKSNRQGLMDIHYMEHCLLALQMCSVRFHTSFYKDIMNHTERKAQVSG